MAGRATFFAYRAGAAVAQRLPAPVGERLAVGIGRLMPVVLPGRRRLVARHQRRVAPAGTPPAPVGDVFASYARYWYELFRLPADVRGGVIDDHFTVEGFEHVEASIAAGRGTILALPHLGGWEWAAAWMSARGHRLLAVVEPAEPPALLEWFAHQRAALGLEVAPLGPDVAGRVLRALRENRMVALVSDRDLNGDGVAVEFFGEATTLPAGPATLALRTGAALVPLAVYFAAGRQHHAIIRPPVATRRGGRLRDDVARITRDLAHAFEDLIRVAPAQWHLLQPNWPSDAGASAGVPRSPAPAPAGDPSCA